MPTITKVCVACGRDVSGEKRVKDSPGQYYCHPCWGAKHGKTAALPSTLVHGEDEAPKVPDGRSAPIKPESHRTFRPPSPEPFKKPPPVKAVRPSWLWRILNFKLADTKAVVISVGVLMLIGVIFLAGSLAYHGLFRVGRPSPEDVEADSARSVSNSDERGSRTVTKTRAQRVDEDPVLQGILSRFPDLEGRLKRREDISYTALQLLNAGKITSGECNYLNDFSRSWP